jgi:3-oxoacyl-[acyl-carrier protein] reductase
MNNYTGRTAIVTGGTRGIGRGIVEMLLSRGATVVACYAGNDDAAAAFRTEMSEQGDRLSVVKLNVADYAAVEAFYGEFEKEHGGLWLLVNNAGIRRDAVVGMMKSDDWNVVIDVNLTGTFNMSKFAVQLMMRKRAGRIVSITSPMGAFGFAGQANYAASKAGQVAMTKSLSKEVASRKITVNCVSPGFIDTDFIGDLPEEQAAAYKKMSPTKRFGTTAEVAACVNFLASDAASYVTGATLEVTGGL